jgi:hypothetical protein
MQAPPAFTPPAARQGKSPMTIVLIVLGVFALCCVLPIGGLVGGGFFVFNQSKGFLECAASGGILESGLKQYIAKNGALPKSNTWMKDLAPFLKATNDAKEMPFNVIDAKDKEWTCTDSNGNKIYFVFNEEVSGRKLDQIKDAETPAIFTTREPSPGSTRKYEPQPFSEAPKVFGKQVGWMIVTAKVPSLAFIDSSGKISTRDVPKVDASGGAMQISAGTDDRK